MQARFFEFLKFNTPEVIITQNEKEAVTLSHCAKVLNRPHYLFKELFLTPQDDEKVFKEELDQLYATLNSFYQNPALVIIPYKTFLTQLPSKTYFDNFKLQLFEEIDLSQLKERLIDWGYQFVEIVESKGEFNVRGNIIDIFSLNLEKPVRIELDDNLIESIYSFDPYTQLSNQELEEVEIFNARLLFNTSFFEAKKEDITQNKEVWATFESNFPLIPQPQHFKEIEVRDINKLLEAKKEKKKVYLIAKDKTALKRSAIKDFSNLNFIFTDAILSVEDEQEVYLSLERKVKKTSAVRYSLVLDELQEGDLVVHQTHGVGVFKGIRNQDYLGSKRDLVEIEYQGGDKLLVPVENLDLLSRYIGEGKVTLDKLGSKAFARRREKAKEELFELANELIERSAKREILTAPQMVIPSEIKLFWKRAGFEYTLDQQRAIEKLLTLLQTPKAMDLLLSGDVGFGKTEVAMSGIFTTAKNGFQSALIVPTTLLSSQHYKTLKERLSPWGIKVAKLDRFVKGKEKKAVLEGLKSGEIDVVVGTHALLECEFKNLAFGIIDEEHKFGNRRSG